MHANEAAKVTEPLFVTKDIVIRFQKGKDGYELTADNEDLYNVATSNILVVLDALKDALHIAKDRKEHINNGTEYEKYYVFRSSKDDNYVVGYGHTPVVIAKEDGRILSVPEMIVEGCGDEIKPFEIDIK